MSLSQTVTKAVDGVIHVFIQQLANKYDFDPSELLAEWEGNSSASKTKKKSSTKKSSITDIPSVDDIDPNELLKYKKPELQALCRQRGLKCTGTKAQLVGYLLGKEPTSAKKSAPKKKVTPKKKAASTPVAKKLTSRVPTVAIRRNQFGNHEHPETSFVFDKKTEKVIGKQNDDGSIADLTSADLETCKQMKFQYVLPDNLDKKSKLDDVKVEELEVDDDEEEKDEEVLESDGEEEEEEVLLDEEELIEDDEEEFNEEFEEDYE